MTAADLMRRADKGLYRSKQAGRNRVSFDGRPRRSGDPGIACALRTVGAAKRRS